MPTRLGGAKKLTSGLSNAKIIDAKNVTFNDVEAIVPRTQVLPLLIEQGGTAKQNWRTSWRIYT